MDDVGDETVVTEMQNRRTFSDLVNSASLLPAYEPIYAMVQGLNKLSDVAAVLYGGRSWNHHFDQTPIPLTKVSSRAKTKGARRQAQPQTKAAVQMPLSAFEQNAVLRGNFDILVLTSNQNFFGTHAYSTILTTLSSTVNTLNATLRRTNTQISFYVDSERKHRTIGYSAIGLFCYIDRIGVGRRATGQNEAVDKERLFLYIEIAVDASFGVEYFKRFFVDWSTTDRRLKDNENGVYLSLTGLFVLPRFISEGRRLQEKKINVDAIRSNMLLKYKLPSLLRELHQPNIEAAISHVMFVLWPTIFASPAYTDVQASIFMRLLEEFECKVDYDGALIPFGSFIARFNNDVVLGQGPTKDLPSFRQIVQWLITAIQLYDGSACYVVGGDAIRRYDETLTVSADIDAKCYTTNPGTLDRVMLILLTINMYLIAHGYFRLSNRYTLKLDGVPFVVEFHGNRQDLVTSVRVLNDFISVGRRPVPLVSVDVRLKYTISYGSVVIGSRLVFTPLDISFWPLAKGSRNLPLTWDDLALIAGACGPTQTYLCFHDATQGSLPSGVARFAQFYQTPIISFADELEDLRALTTTQQAQRAAVGKKEKDLRRFALFQHLNETVYGKNPQKPAYINDVPTRLIQGLEQIWVINRASALAQNSDEVMGFYGKLLQGQDQGQGINALLKEGRADFVLNLFAGAKRILAANKRFKTPFGLNDLDLIASHDTDGYASEAMVDSAANQKPFSLEKTWPVSNSPINQLKRSKSKSKSNSRTRRTKRTRRSREQTLVETVLPLLP